MCEQRKLEQVQSKLRAIDYQKIELKDKRLIPADLEFHIEQEPEQDGAPLIPIHTGSNMPDIFENMPRIAMIR